MPKPWNSLGTFRHVSISWLETWLPKSTKAHHHTYKRTNIWELIDKLPCWQLVKQCKNLENHNSLLANYTQNVGQTLTFNGGQTKPKAYTKFLFMVDGRCNNAYHAQFKTLITSRHAIGQCLQTLFNRKRFEAFKNICKTFFTI
jgi:hypothetical protein